jgi:hypothetical protein
LADFPFRFIIFETAAFGKSASPVDPFSFVSSHDSAELEPFSIPAAELLGFFVDDDQVRVVANKLMGNFSFFSINDDVKQLSLDETFRSVKQMTQSLD